MDWVNHFYSKTGQWWGPAEYKITERDHKRAQIIKRLYPSVKTVLELGSSYGNTTAACAEVGMDVTGIEMSDRADFAEKHNQKEYKGSLKIIKEDFYHVALNNKFDVVAYWNGFGIGTDEDQKNLLKKVASWLQPNGIALIDIANPITWKHWAGEEQQLTSRPKEGYNYNISEKIDFDKTNNRFTDTWWETEKPDEKLTQSIRCYLPSELEQLLKGTGLQLRRIEVNGNEFDVNNYEQFLNNEHDNEYLTVLKLG